MKLKSEFNSMSEFRLTKPSEYHKACKEGVLEKIAELYGWEFKAKKYHWTLEDFLETTVNCGSYSEWRKTQKKAYRAACRLKMTDKVCDMKSWAKRRENGYWTKDRCIKEARKHKTISSWNKSSPGSRDAAQEHGWMKECTSHMPHVVNKKNGQLKWF